MQFFIEPDFPAHPQCYRSVCEACGAGSRGEPVLNVSSMSIDHEDGRYTPLYLCKFCVVEWARAFGVIAPEEAETLVQESYVLASQVRELQRELDSLTAVREAIQRVAREGLIVDAEVV